MSSNGVHVFGEGWFSSEVPPTVGSMSIPVDVDRLASVVGDFPAAYLLTVTSGGKVKVVSADPVVCEGFLALPPSAGSERNLAANPAATLLFPPAEHHGYALLVDGEAEADESEIRFTPATAVLHRPARHADGPPAPGALEGRSNECRPL